MLTPSSPKKTSRIGQWDGRRRSSRADGPALPQLWQRPVLVRLGAVLAMAVGVTLLAFYWGPSHAYRVGQACPHDLRARVYFEVVDHVQTARKRDEAVAALPAEMQSDPAACESARQAMPPVVERYPPGALLVQRGRSITDPHYRLLKTENYAFQASQSSADHVRRGMSRSEEHTSELQS